MKKIVLFLLCCTTVMQAWQTDFYQAVRTGDLDKVGKYLEKQVLSPSQVGNAFSLATLNKQAQVVKKVIESRHFDIRSEKFKQQARGYLRSGFRNIEENSDLFTAQILFDALVESINHQNRPLAEFLLNNINFVNFDTLGNLLYINISKQREKMSEIIINSRAFPFISDSYINRSLQLAIEQNFPELVYQIVDKIDLDKIEINTLQEIFLKFVINIESDDYIYVIKRIIENYTFKCFDSTVLYDCLEYCLDQKDDELYNLILAHISLVQLDQLQRSDRDNILGLPVQIDRAQTPRIFSPFSPLTPGSNPGRRLAATHTSDSDLPEITPELMSGSLSRGDGAMSAFSVYATPVGKGPTLFPISPPDQNQEQ